MVSEELKNRAETLVANAHGTEIEPYDLIILADGHNLVSKISSDDDHPPFSRGFLSDKPVIDYFDQDEQPHYLIYNELMGVSIGNNKNKSNIKGNHQNTLWVTDKGIHFAIGRSEGDFHKFLSFDRIKDIEQKGNSLLSMKSHKFVFYTVNNTKIEFGADSSLDKEEAFNYMQQMISNSESTKNGGSTTSKAEKENKSIQPSEGKSEIDLVALQKVDEYDFEHIVSNIWKQQGWKTEVTTESGDRGIDIKAEKEDPFQQLFYIQAKRYSAGNNVSSSEIQKYAGLYAREETVDTVVVVTTSGFTAEAERVAENRNVKIIEGSQLIEMIHEHDIEI